MIKLSNSLSVTKSFLFFRKNDHSFDRLTFLSKELFEAINQCLLTCCVCAVCSSHLQNHAQHTAQRFALQHFQPFCLADRPGNIAPTTQLRFSSGTRRCMQHIGSLRDNSGFGATVTAAAKCIHACGSRSTVWPGSIAIFIPLCNRNGFRLVFVPLRTCSVWCSRCQAQDRPCRMQAGSDRRYQLVVCGATGVVGRCVCTTMVKHYQV